MSMVRQGRPVQLRLRKELTRAIKRGHAWLYSDALERVDAEAGTVAMLGDRRGDQRLASGIYDPGHAIPLRICRTQPPFRLDDAWLADRLTAALALRRTAFDSQTTGYRLLAGEGDWVPGLIIDVYGDTAVMKVDGGGPQAFYQPPAIADWLVEQAGLRNVVLRFRERGRVGQVLRGDVGSGHVAFLENGLRFESQVLVGQKTGFFLDQRDNRDLIRRVSRGRSVLNLFSFTGGFSIAAGVGGARLVTSVDSARPAIEMVDRHWQRNELASGVHQAQVADCFEYLESAAAEGAVWEVVICDPPSFAPSEKALDQARASYLRLTQMAARVTAPGGLLALASCSSHIAAQDFRQIHAEGLGKARRLARLLVERGLPLDHPTPLAMPELRYLKFNLFQLD